MIEAAKYSSGLADVGVGIPLVQLALLGFIILAVVVTAGFAMRRRRPDNPQAISPLRLLWVAWSIWFGVSIVVVIASSAAITLEPGSISGPGLGVAETRSDGLTRWGTSASWRESTKSQHYIIRVAPGEAWTVLASVRNTGPLPMQLVGWLRPEIAYGSQSGAKLDDYVVGLALPRNSKSPSAMPSDIVPFHPVEIAPGGELVFVIVGVGGECADPSAVVLRQDPSRQVHREYPLVFNVMGWQRSGVLWPQFDATVASRSGCERAP